MNLFTHLQKTREKNKLLKHRINETTLFTSTVNAMIYLLNQVLLLLENPAVSVQISKF